MSLILLLARLGLGITLVIAGASKSTGRLKFEQSLYKFGFVPVASVRTLSFTVPATELILGILMTLGLFAREAAVASGFLIGVFSVGIALNLMENRHVECGCFGVFSERPVTGWSLLRNALLVVVATAIAIGGPGALALR